jgi:hypothetical protein
LISESRTSIQTSELASDRSENRFRLFGLRTGLLALTLAPLATAALAQDRPAWEGYWAANAAWCENAGKVGEGTPDYYGPSGIYGLEWSCEVRSAVPIGIGQSWAVRMQCFDTGETFSSDQIFMITKDDRLLLITEYGEMTDLVRCAAPKE